MATWAEVERAAPELAAQVLERFRAHRHHTLATLRRDGAPRISGTEVQFSGGNVWLGSMPRARKALDLLRDPRFALHSTSDDPDDDDPSAWSGDAKLSGRAVEVTDPEELDEARRHLGADAGRGSHLFRLDLREVVTTVVGTPADHLLIRLWTPQGGLQEFRR